MVKLACKGTLMVCIILVFSLTMIITNAQTMLNVPELVKAPHATSCDKTTDPNGCMHTKEANAYTRGCSEHTRCKRDV